MAYPVVSAPYGLKPINEIGGLPYAGSTRMVPIASGYAQSLNYGDPVKLTTTGTLISSALQYNSAATETGGTLGIFLGCEYTPSGGPLYGKQRYQSWASTTVASDAVAYVCDDPNVVFKAVMVAYTTGSTIAVASATPLSFGTNLGSMATATANTGTAGNLVGNSNVGLMASSGNARLTSTAPFRIVGLVPETVVTQVQTANTATSTTMTLTAANSSIVAGMLVTGSGIPANTVVAAVSGTTVTLSAASTTSLTGASFTFVGYPEVLVKWNFGYHAYQNAVAI